MSMRKWTIIGLTFLLLAVLCGCGIQELPNTYVEGSDFQYMQWVNGMFFSKVQQVESGCYFFYEGYLYYLDEQADTILPLCSKADCLHDKEAPPLDVQTAADRKEWIDLCNARVAFPIDASNIGIAWCSGSLYCLSPNVPSDTGAFGTAALYRCSPDGSRKDIVYRWDNTVDIEQWIVHRDVLYYVEHKYQTIDSNVRDVYSVKALALKGTALQPETIYTTDETIYVTSLNHPRAYGNYLYFQVIGDTAGQAVVTDENYREYLYIKTFVYDMKNKQLGEVGLPDMNKYQAVQGVIFWNEKIVFRISDFAAEKQETYTFYIADLDGKNPAVLVEDFPQWQLLSDGKYLYATNVQAAYEAGEPGIYWAYDANMELVDTFQMPRAQFYANPVGDAQTAYWPFYYGEESQKQGKAGFGLMCWDKSKIGAYNGGTVEVEYIVR